MGIPVGSQFRQIVGKIHDWKISFRNRVYHSCKSVPFTEKKPEVGIKEGFQEMEHEYFPF